MPSCPEILAFCKGFWETIDSMHHSVEKVFAAGENGDEIMMYGHVTYKFKSVGEKELDWAARAKLQVAGGNVKFTFYQVYLVS